METDLPETAPQDADAVIVSKVWTRLLWDPRVDLANLHVVAEDGVVVLMGSVPSHLAREAAYQGALSAAGAAEVRNRLLVCSPETCIAPSDGDIRWRVRRVIEMHPDLDASTVSVSVEDGVVTLRGTVDACWKKYHVEDLVGGGYGVASVRNELAVVTSGRLADRILADCVVATIDRMAFVAAETVSVQVDDGVVTLSGTVATEVMRQVVCRLARGVHGVREVVDHLRV